MLSLPLAPASRKNRKHIEREMRFAPATATTDAVLGLFVGKLAVHYVLTAIRTDFAGTAAVQLDKLHATDPEQYHLLIEEDGHCTCDCAGHIYTGHCKHADAIQELAARGELPEPARDQIDPVDYAAFAARHYATPPHPVMYRDIEGEIAAAYGPNRAA